MNVWRVLLRLFVDRHELGSVQAIDATGFGRRVVSGHYGKGIKCHFQAVKTNAFADCDANVIIDVRCSMKLPRDAQIGRRVLARISTE